MFLFVDEPTIHCSTLLVCCSMKGKSFRLLDHIHPFGHYPVNVKCYIPLYYDSIFLLPNEWLPFSHIGRVFIYLFNAWTIMAGSGMTKIGSLNGETYLQFLTSVKTVDWSCNLTLSSLVM